MDIFKVISDYIAVNTAYTTYPNKDRLTVNYEGSLRPAIWLATIYRNNTDLMVFTYNTASESTGRQHMILLHLADPGMLQKLIQLLTEQAKWWISSK